MSLQKLLVQANEHRLAGRWAEAETLYRQATQAAPGQSALHQNVALCALAQGKLSLAVTEGKRALEVAPNNAGARTLVAMALRKMRKVEEAADVLFKGLQYTPTHGQMLSELAELYLHDFGDAQAARRVAEVLATLPEYADTAALTKLVSYTYDRGDMSAEAVTQMAKDFTAAYIQPYRVEGLTPAGPITREKKRVGVLSPLLGRTPVYYLAYGALAAIADQVELVFFDRARTPTESPERSAFQALAKPEHWVSCANAQPHDLARLMASHDLDVLLEMGGWGDVNGLRACASKPARKMFKWIGGQSLTTGLDCFDGWLTDCEQSSPALRPLYTEPLIELATGYASYTPPANTPRVRAKSEFLGVAANPVKVSEGFLVRVANLLRSSDHKVCFIDRRYATAYARARVLKHLSGLEARVRFVVPKSHEEYLLALGSLGAMLDTAPYTSGLTALESLWVGTPLLTEPNGKLFCERHGHAHAAFSTQGEVSLDNLPRLAGQNYLAGTLRLDHAAIGAQLLHVLDK